MNALLMDILPAGLFVFILGLVVVFFGIAIIVLVVSIIGSIMKKNSAKPKTEKTVQVSQAPQPAPASSDVDDKVKAAIVAAITAYYFAENSSNPNCEFVVRKIKRL